MLFLDDAPSWDVVTGRIVHLIIWASDPSVASLDTARRWQ